MVFIMPFVFRILMKRITAPTKIKEKLKADGRIINQLQFAERFRRVKAKTEGLLTDEL